MTTEVDMQKIMETEKKEGKSIDRDDSCGAKKGQSDLVFADKKEKEREREREKERER